MKDVSPRTAAEIIGAFALLLAGGLITQIINQNLQNKRAMAAVKPTLEKMAEIDMEKRQMISRYHYSPDTRCVELKGPKTTLRFNTNEPMINGYIKYINTMDSLNREYTKMQAKRDSIYRAFGRNPFESER